MTVEPQWGVMLTVERGPVLHRWTALSRTACGLTARCVPGTAERRCWQCARYRSQAERRAANAARQRRREARIRDARARMERAAGPVLDAWAARRAA